MVDYEADWPSYRYLAEQSARAVEQSAVEYRGHKVGSRPSLMLSDTMPLKDANYPPTPTPRPSLFILTLLKIHFTFSLFHPILPTLFLSLALLLPPSLIK